MSAEAEKVDEQNSLLLNFLTGTWTTRITAYVHKVRGSRTSTYTRFGGANFRGLFQRQADGSVAGHYIPTGADESTKDCILRLGLDRSDSTLVAFLGNDESVPGIKGVWSDSALHFHSDFHDGITVWKVFQAIMPKVTARPSTVSIIVRQASESIWFLDVAFVVQQSSPSKSMQVRRRCRLEFWHSRQGPGDSTPPHPQDVKESFEKILRRCDEVTQDVELRVDEIDEIIASLEDNRAKCEEQLRLLKELQSNARSGKNDADFLDYDVQDAMLEMHEASLVLATGSGATEDSRIRRLSDSDLKAFVGFTNPEVWLFKGPVYARLRATICGECGHTELTAENPGSLYEAYLKSQGQKEGSA
jgi:hypothetical protein